MCVGGFIPRQYTIALCFRYSKCIKGCPRRTLFVATSAVYGFAPHWSTYKERSFRQKSEKVMFVEDKTLNSTRYQFTGIRNYSYIVHRSVQKVKYYAIISLDGLLGRMAHSIQSKQLRRADVGVLIAKPEGCASSRPSLEHVKKLYMTQISRALGVAHMYTPRKILRGKLCPSVRVCHQPVVTNCTTKLPMSCSPYLNRYFYELYLY